MVTRPAPSPERPAGATAPAPSAVLQLREATQTFALEDVPVSPVVSLGRGFSAPVKLRVQRSDGSAVPNLYAAGEILGKGSLSGHAYVGGMSLTPALTFGRMIAQRMEIPA